ncbi:DUF3232 domain-containing protein [Moorellaceae bacterium AZ2]
MTPKERISALIQAINMSGTPHKKDDLQSVEDFIEDCGKYIDSVMAMEAALAVARYRMEPEDYREHIIELDRRRKLNHDALIASVRLVNRLAKLYGCEPVYTGPDERIAIAEFAMEITQEFFAERKL